MVNPLRRCALRQVKRITLRLALLPKADARGEFEQDDLPLAVDRQLIHRTSPAHTVPFIMSTMNEQEYVPGFPYKVDDSK